MNAFIQTIFGLLVTLLLISCKKEVVVVPHQKQFLQLQKADWFLGRWENNSEEGNLSEIWKKQNDSTFYGESYFVIKNDTVFAETIQLQERSGALSYVVSIPNQNEEEPVTFQLNKNTNDGLILPANTPLPLPNGDNLEYLLRRGIDNYYTQNIRV